jgi:polygalacturonase
MASGRGKRSRRQFVTAMAAGAAGSPAVAAALNAAVPQPTGHAPERGPANLFDVSSFHAVGDGKTLSTKAFQAAIDACAAAGGGMVWVPPGEYLLGALTLRSNLQLHLCGGATLMASKDPAHYPPVPGRAEGIERTVYSSLLTGRDLENVAITGQGVLDGQGPGWWQAHQQTRDLRLARNLPREAENPAGAPLRWPEPRVINLLRCQGVLISGITIRDSPSYNIHLIYCQDVGLENLCLTGLEAQHCDGVVVDSCKRVRISHCSLGSGGESVALKSGFNEDGRRVGIPCEDVVVSNCNLFFSAGAAIAIGSETAGGIRNVTIDNCTISDCLYGVHLRSPRGRGGVVERIRVSNLVLDRIGESVLFMTHFFDSLRMDSLFGEGPSPKNNPELDRTIRPPAGVGTPTFRDIQLSGLTVGAAPRIATIEGLPERFISGITISDVVAPHVKAGIVLQRAARVRVAGLSLGRIDWPAVAARDVERLEVSRLTVDEPSARVPPIELQNVAGAFIHGCDVPRRGPELVRLHGANRDVTLVSNNEPAPKPGPV